MNRQALLAWYDANGRDLPWRRTKDPYAIWVSEAMLQQTQIATALPYYQRWMNAFPTLSHLANAEEQEVLAAWQGLGYYRRCRYLHAGAKWVQQNGWPQTAAEWRSIPGVGPYTAGAIASIAFGEAAPVVDGNVERVFARLTGNAAAGPKLTSSAWEWAREVLASSRPADWNQALMELGATVCKPRSPLCDACPLKEECLARREGRVESLPTRLPRIPVVELEFHVWIPLCNGRLGIRQIPVGDWWEGMWEFPRSASRDDLSNVVGNCSLNEIGTIKHTVTKHRISFVASLAKCARQESQLRWVQPGELDAIAMPSPQRKLLRLAARHCGIF